MLAINDRVETLLATLEGRDARYGSAHALMLRGALIALDDAENPDRIAQSAHSMRELLDKLPTQYSGAPVHAHPKDLKDHLETIVKPFARLREVATEMTVDPFSDSVPSSVRVAVFEAIESVELARASEPNRHSRREQFLASVDSIGVFAPKAGEDPRLESWARVESKFQRIAHHNTVPTEEQFVALLIEAIELLSVILAPPTAATVQLLDEIIREGEKNG